MAELLVKAVDTTHADPRKDAWCYKRGDVVVVFEDGHPWGHEEGPPIFDVVMVPGVPAAKFQGYLQAGAAQRRLQSVAIDTLPVKTLAEADITAATVTKPVIPPPVKG